MGVGMWPVGAHAAQLKPWVRNIPSWNASCPPTAPKKAVVVHPWQHIRPRFLHRGRFIFIACPVWLTGFFVNTRLALSNKCGYLFKKKVSASGESSSLCGYLLFFNKYPYFYFISICEAFTSLSQQGNLSWLWQIVYMLTFWFNKLIGICRL